jgi:hypothetical protein
MLRFIQFALFISLCSCDDNCFKKSLERDLFISNGAFTIVSYDEALGKINKIVYVPRKTYTTQYDILEEIRKVIKQNLGVNDNYLTIQNYRDMFCFQTKGKLFLSLNENIGMMLATDSLMRFLVPENTSYHVADIEKRSSKDTSTVAYNKINNTTLENITNNISTTRRQERKNDSVTSTVAYEIDTQGYNKINYTTLGNITNNGSTTTNVDENSENISVVVIIEVVFAILACFAIILGLIIFVSNVMKKQQT